jgi:hypothetical protein
MFCTVGNILEALLLPYFSSTGMSRYFVPYFFSSEVWCQTVTGTQHF